MYSYWNFADDLGTGMVTLVVGSEQRAFVVHKSLLVNQCNYFRGALTSSLYKEAVEGVMKFEDESPSVMRLLVGYLYNKDIPQIQPFVRKPKFTPLPAKKQADNFPHMARPPCTIDVACRFNATVNDPHGSSGQVRALHVSATAAKYSPEEIRLGDYEAAVKRGLDPRDVRTWPSIAHPPAGDDKKKKRRQVPRSRREWLQRKADLDPPATYFTLPKDDAKVISSPRDHSEGDARVPAPRTPEKGEARATAQGASTGEMEKEKGKNEGSVGQGASAGSKSEGSVKPVGKGLEVCSVEGQRRHSSSPIGVLKALPIFTFRSKKPTSVGSPLSSSPMARAKSKFFGGSAPGSGGKETAEMSTDDQDTAIQEATADGDTATEGTTGKVKRRASCKSTMPSFARSAATWAKSITAQATAEVQSSTTEPQGAQQQQQDAPLFTFGGDAMDEDARDPTGTGEGRTQTGGQSAAPTTTGPRVLSGRTVAASADATSSFCRKPPTVATHDWIGWLRDPRDPDFPTSKVTFMENEKHQLDLLRLAVLAERLCWDQLFNAAVNAYLDGEERVMRRPLVALEHVDIAYNGGTYPGSPLRRLFSDMVHFEVKTSLTHSRYLDLAKDSEDFLGDLFHRLDLAVWSPGKSPFNTLKDPLRARRCLYHHHADWSSNKCF